MMASIPRSGTVIVGVLNVTPDSFSDGGRFLDVGLARAHAMSMMSAGADIIDIGGESTRPGATPIDSVAELERVLPVVESLSDAGITVSIDTMHSRTATAALDAGASIVNDVSGGIADQKMFAAVAPYDCQFVIGHLRGSPQTMLRFARYRDVVSDVASELEQQVIAACEAGIGRDRLAIDPCIGFAKEPDHDWEILRGIAALERLGLPLMVGVSRKSFLRELLAPGASAVERDFPTALLSTYLALHGVNAIRVHDVDSTRIAVALAKKLAPLADSREVSRHGFDSSNGAQS